MATKRKNSAYSLEIKYDVVTALENVEKAADLARKYNVKQTPFLTGKSWQIEFKWIMKVASLEVLYCICHWDVAPTFMYNVYTCNFLFIKMWSKKIDENLKMQLQMCLSFGNIYDFW